MNEAYQVASPTDTHSLPDSQEIAGLLCRDGQLILPLLELVEHAQCAIDDLVDVIGRATIEAVLAMNIEQLVTPKQQGRKSDRDVAYHGTKKGRVVSKERQLGVTNPVQHCRNHKLKNVFGHLPKEQHHQTKSTMKAGFDLSDDEGIAKLKQFAGWLEHDGTSVNLAAGGARRVVHHHRLGPALEAETLPGDDQLDRQQPRGGASAH